MWHTFEGQIFITLSVSSQVYPTEDDLITKLSWDNHLLCDNFDADFKNVIGIILAIWREIGPTPYFEGTKKTLFTTLLVSMDNRNGHLDYQ